MSSRQQKEHGGHHVTASRSQHVCRASRSSWRFSTTLLLLLLGHRRVPKRNVLLVALEQVGSALRRSGVDWVTYPISGVWISAIRCVLSRDLLHALGLSIILLSL